jgi:hypothetical protein
MKRFFLSFMKKPISMSRITESGKSNGKSALSAGAIISVVPLIRIHVPY